MFKLFFYLNMLLIFIIPNDGKTFKKGRLNDNLLKDDTSWQHLWFPHPPNYKNDVKLQLVNVAAGEKSTDGISDHNNTSGWPGLWFPIPPNYQNNKIVKEGSVKFEDNNDKKHDCDNGMNYLSVDFDPKDKRHSFNYLCLGKRSEYAPNLNTSALMREYVIPSAYEPPVKCLNESIEYTSSIPTFGAFRPLAPKFGTYKFLPPQRWLHSLADGGIVLLYHPCAFPGQKEQLQNTLKGCLYRHIITPSQLLTPQHPLALLAWGKSLQMSVVDDAIVVKFIKDNAKVGFKRKQRKLKTTTKLYDAGILAEAHLVTDEQDKEICGYKEMR